MKHSKNLITYFLLLLLISCSGAKHTKSKVNDKSVTPPFKEEVKTEQVVKSEKNMINDIKTSDKLSGLNILISASKTLKYTAFKLTDPLRLIVDISGMEKNYNIPTELNINNDIINKIKILHFKTGNIQRLEIGLNKLVHHEIKRLKNYTLSINLKRGNGQKDVALTGKDNTNNLIQASSKTTLTKTGNLETEKVQELDFEFEMQEEAVYEEFIEDENIIYEDIASTIMDKTQKEQIVVEEVKSENYKQKLPKKTGHKISNNDQKKRYTGKLISLDFQDAEVANILRFIAEISNLNIISTDDVTGKVNLKLTSVPWDQALDIVLKAKGLGMERVGNVIRIATLSKLKKEKELFIKSVEIEREAKQRKEKARMDAITAKKKVEELFTDIISINYASADEIVKNIEKLKGDRGEIDINERTNTLIIKDTRKNLKSIKKLTKMLDKRTPQVMIEARIVEVTRTLSKEIGIQWGGLYSKSTSYAFPDNVGFSGGIAPATSTSDLQLINTLPGGGNFITNMPAAVGSGSGGAIGLSLGHITGSAALDITLSALESSGNGKILSNPKITTEDNKKATIESGRSIPYSTVSQSGTSVQFVDAVISLEVKPHITQDGFVSMEITATKNDADFANQVQGTPSILTKKAETQVLVKDGDTTVIGGLYTNSTSRSQAGIPLLSKLPFIGWLFKKKSNDESSTELLIFITPKIIKI